MAEEEERKPGGKFNPLKNVPKDKRALVVVGGAAVVVVAYAWWRNGQTSSEASEAAMDAAYTDDGYVTQATAGDLGYTTGTTAGESDTDTSGGLPAFKSFAEWSQYATEQLAAAGTDIAAIQSALGKYRDRLPLTSAEQDIVRRALGAAGNPPDGSYTVIPAIESPEPSKLAAPTGLKAVKTTSTTVDLSWNKVTGAGNYRVYRSGASQNVGASYDTTAQIGGLQPDTSYTFTVAAGQTGSESVGPRSSPVTVRTAKPSVKTPSTPTASQITKSSVYLSWPKVSGATNYRIYREGIGEPIGHSVDGKYRASGLGAGRTYRFAVAAMVGNTTGKKSGWRTVKTKK